MQTNTATGRVSRRYAPEFFVVRPWGEQFVQSIFNAVEEEYSIIDNLSPESAGIRYQIADKGALATSKDAARFLFFNIFETSLKQKAQILGDECSGEAPCEPTKDQRWDLLEARKLGFKLPLAALEPNDQFGRCWRKTPTMAKRCARGTTTPSAMRTIPMRSAPKKSFSYAIKP